MRFLFLALFVLLLFCHQSIFKNFQKFRNPKMTPALNFQKFWSPLSCYKEMLPISRQTLRWWSKGASVLYLECHGNSTWKFCKILQNLQLTKELKWFLHPLKLWLFHIYEEYRIENREKIFWKIGRKKNRLKEYFSAKSAPSEV